MDAFFLIEHFTRPVAPATQQVTAPARPQTDLLAQPMTNPRQAFGNVPPFTRPASTPFAHRT
jgi:hypothetical protein